MIAVLDGSPVAIRVAVRDVSLVEDLEGADRARYKGLHTPSLA
jgi:hypothetical protein